MVPHFARDIQYRNWKILTLEKERKKKWNLELFLWKKEEEGTIDGPGE